MQEAVGVGNGGCAAVNVVASEGDFVRSLRDHIESPGDCAGEIAGATGQAAPEGEGGRAGAGDFTGAERAEGGTGQTVDRLVETIEVERAAGHADISCGGNGIAAKNLVGTPQLHGCARIDRADFVNGVGGAVEQSRALTGGQTEPDIAARPGNFQRADSRLVEHDIGVGHIRIPHIAGQGEMAGRRRYVDRAVRRAQGDVDQTSRRCVCCPRVTQRAAGQKQGAGISETARPAVRNRRNRQHPKPDFRSAGVRVGTSECLGATADLDNTAGAGNGTGKFRPPILASDAQRTRAEEDIATACSASSQGLDRGICIVKIIDGTCGIGEHDFRTNTGGVYRHAQRCCQPPALLPAAT